MPTNQLLLLLFAVFLSSCSSTDILIFSSSRLGNSDIFSMNGKGKKLKQLTTAETEEWGPTFYNSDRITFLRQQGNQFYRYALNLETGEETQFTHPANCVLDDKNILYGPISGRHLYPCGNDIFLANKKGEEVKNLTSQLDGQSAYPSWTAQEDKIIFTNNGNGNNEIYELDLKSGQLSQLTNHPANDERGTLSPNGDYLLFSSNRENDNQDLYILQIKNQSIKNITNSSGIELIGRWSKSGKKLYYGSNKDGNWEIYSYHLQSGKIKRLTFNTAFDGDPRILLMPKK